MSTDSISTELRLEELDNILVRDTELTQFKILILQPNSNYYNDRSRANSFFSLARICRPDSLLLALSRLLSSSLPDLRAQAALHISEIVSSSVTKLNEPETTLDTLKSALLYAFENLVLIASRTYEPLERYVNNLFQAISNFHATGRWPELLPFLFECVKTQSPHLQEKTLLAFKWLAQNLNGNTALIPHSNTFRVIFSKCLGNRSSNDVKIAALDTLICFVPFIPIRTDPGYFDFLLPLIMKTLTEALNSGSESMTEDFLQLLIEFAKTSPMFFERQLEKVLRLMLKITVDDSLEVGIRHLAIEFLMALVRNAPIMIIKEPQFIKRLFDELMYNLFDIEVVEEFENFWETSNYILGKKCLSELSPLLGENTIFQWVQRVLSHLLDTSIWQQRHAALIAIPEIAKGCKQLVLENLEELVPKVLESVNDPHLCVRLAAINAIQLLSLRFRPQFLERYPEIVMITLYETFKEFSIPKLQASAASALLCLFGNDSENILVRYRKRIEIEISRFMEPSHKLLQISPQSHTLDDIAKYSPMSACLLKDSTNALTSHCRNCGGEESGN